jgi:hypothetical protein
LPVCDEFNDNFSRRGYIHACVTRLFGLTALEGDRWMLNDYDQQPTGLFLGQHHSRANRPAQQNVMDVLIERSASFCAKALQTDKPPREECERPKPLWCRLATIRNGGLEPVMLTPPKIWSIFSKHRRASLAVLMRRATL